VLFVGKLIVFDFCFSEVGVLLVGNFPNSSNVSTSSEFFAFLVDDGDELKVKMTLMPVFISIRKMIQKLLAGQTGL
jgi:hypothetical protein